MLLTERRFPAANAGAHMAADRLRGPGPAASELRVRESNLDYEIQRCRGTIQANKAERMFQTTLEGRRG